LLASPLLNPRNMKNIRTTLNTLLVILASATLAQAAPATPNKVRYKVDELMTATGVDADATGRVQAFVKKQGNSDHQRLRVSAQNLDPKTPYTLVAQLGDSNDVFVVTTFTTTDEGVGKVLFFQNRRLKGNGLNGRGAGVSKHALPDVIDPLTDVRTLSIINSNSEVVLTLDLYAAAGMEFELASVFNNTGSDPNAIGCVAAACVSGSMQFRLFAAGQSSEYTFCVNDSAVATYKADWSGRISVGALPSGAPSPLLFKKLDVRNVVNEIVLESDVR